MEAYIVSSLFQLITAIQLKQYRNGSADLYIINQFVGAERYLKKIKSMKIFNDCTLVENVHPKYFARLRACFYRNLLYSPIGGKIIKKKYECILYGADELTSYVMIKYCKKINPMIDIILFEDGIGSYYRDMTYNTPRFDIWYHKIFGGVELYTTYEEQKKIRDAEYLYEPEIRRSPGAQKIQCMLFDERMKKCLDELFDLENVKLADTSVVLLDASSWIFKTDYYDVVLTKMKNILKEVYVNEFAVKLHPRRKNDIYLDVGKFCIQSLPMEAMYSKMQGHISKMVLIGFFSTSMMTAYTMFNEMPTIVACHWFLVGHVGVTYDDCIVLDELLERLKEKYLVENKIFAPKDFVEFKEICERLKGGVES